MFIWVTALLLCIALDSKHVLASPPDSPQFAIYPIFIILLPDGNEVYPAPYFAGYSNS